MELTIKQIADELNVSKTAIRKHMDESFRNTYTKKKGNKILITDGGIKKLKSQFASHEAENNGASSNGQGSQVPEEQSEEVKLLSQQFEESLKQIKEKDKQIAELHQLLDQSQRLQLDVQSKLKQLEHQDQDKITAGASSETTATPKKHHWWQFNR